MILEEYLRKYFNYSLFRPGQKEVITSILQGNHTIAMLPTGTGKSLCYQLPGYLLKGQIIIISPLLSLMQDQSEQLMMNGEKRVIAFNSFLSLAEKKQALTQLKQYKFIFISPEMLHMQNVLERLKELEIALFVIDEAHCISQWGYDFRPDYHKLGKIRENLGNPLTLILTATATQEVKEDIISSLSLDTWKEYIYSVDRPNISLSVQYFNSYHEKSRRLIELVKSLKGPGIIYFSSKKVSEQMVSLLKESGMGRTAAYHGGMDHETRILIQQQFIQGQLDVICATSAFGMGINKDNIRFVIHFHMPLQLESYLQEIGRAGRDGKKSIAILLFAIGDEQLSFQLADTELPKADQIQRVHEWMNENQVGKSSIASYELEISKYAGLTDTHWRIIVDYLQSSKYETINEAIQQLNYFIQLRSQFKRQKIYEMGKWVQTDSCRRKNILKYFKEDITIEVVDCCDQCGIDFSNFYSSENETKHNERSEEFNWKEQLAKILVRETVK